MTFLIPGCRHICTLLLLKSFTHHQRLFTCLFTLKIICEVTCNNLSSNTSHSHNLLQSCLVYNLAQWLSTHDHSKSSYQVTISSLICETRDTDVPLRIVMRLKWQYVFEIYSTGPGSQYAHNMPAIGITLVLISLIMISPLLLPNVYIPSLLVYFFERSSY